MSDVNNNWDRRKTIGASLEIFGKHIMGVSGLMGAGALGAGGGESLISHICVVTTVLGYVLLGIGMALCKYYGAPDDSVAVVGYRNFPLREPTTPPQDKGEH